MASKSKKNKRADANDGQTEVLANFISVTGASEEVAKNMLEACNNELDMAIGMYLDSGLAEDSGGGGGAGGSRSRNGRSSASASPKRNGGRRRSKTKTPTDDEAYLEDDDDYVRAPIPQKMEQLVDDMVIVNPKRIPSIASTKVRSVFDGFRDFRREAEEQQRAMLSGESSMGGDDSSSSSSPSSSNFSSSSSTGAFGNKSSKKLKTLEELFRPPVDLLYPGTFIGAREEGKAGNLWLLINIQNHKEFACQCLNRDIWSHSTIRDLVKRHFVFWQVYHDSTEGVKYEQFYPIGQYPYIAILDPRTGERLLTINKFDALSFSETMTEFLREHPSPDGTTHAADAQNHRSYANTAAGSSLSSSSSSTTSTSFPMAAAVSSPGGKRKFDPSTNSSSAPEGSSTSTSSSSFSSVPKKQRFTAEAAFESIMDESEDSQLEAAIRASLADAEKSGAGGGKIKNAKGSGNDGNNAVGTSTNGKRPEKETETTESDEDGFETEGELETFSSSSDEEEEADDAEEGRTAKSGKKAAESKPVTTTAVKLTAEEDRNGDDDKDDSLNSSRDVSTRDDNDDDDDAGGVSSEPTEDWKRWCASETETNKTKIIFRLPDGARQQLELVSDAPLIALTLYANSLGFPAERFELITNFPRKKLSYMDGDSTLKSVGIFGQEQVFVQEREIPLAK